MQFKSLETTSNNGRGRMRGKGESLRKSSRKSSRDRSGEECFPSINTRTRADTPMEMSAKEEGLVCSAAMSYRIGFAINLARTKVNCIPVILKCE